MKNYLSYILGLIVIVSLGLVYTPVATAQTMACSLIVHRGYHNLTLDEETVESVKKSAPFGFGAEIDARVALDGLVAVHDDRLTRITGGNDTRQPETMTMEQLHAVQLKHGGRLASIGRLIQAAKKSGGKLLIEGKRYPNFTMAWNNRGFEAISTAIRSRGMVKRVWVGGTLGWTRGMHSVDPGLRYFWRRDADEPLTVTAAESRWATLVEASAEAWTSVSADNMRNAGIRPATRNADSPEEWDAALLAGVRLWQTNSPHAARSYCS